MKTTKPTRPGRDCEKSPPSSRPHETPAPITETSPPPSKPGKGSRRGAIVVLILIVVSLAWYFVSDRLTPYTSQARVQAFVVPVAAQVAGTVVKVYVKNNDDVQPGQRLFDIDPTQYRIALQRSRSDYESVRQSVNASTSSVQSARASLQAAEASNVYAEQDATRLEQIHKEDPGAISARRVQNAQATRLTAQSQVAKAEADLRRAQDTAGLSGDKNAQLLSARAAIEKAELDLKRTEVIAPAGGSVTDLRTDVGQYTQVGAPAMTLIAIHDLWISADMTENNLGNIKPGDKVAIVLDVMPGEVLKGRVRSVGTGISAGNPASTGHPAPGPEQPRLVATSPAISGRRRIRPVRTRPAAWRANRGPGRRAGLHGRPRPDELACRDLHQGNELLFVSLLIADGAR